MNPANNLNIKQQNLLEIYTTLTSRARFVSWFPKISFLIFELIHNLQTDLKILHQDSSFPIKFSHLLDKNILNLLMSEINFILDDKNSSFDDSEKFIGKNQNHLIYLKYYIEKLQNWLPLDLFK